MPALILTGLFFFCWDPRSISSLFKTIIISAPVEKVFNYVEDPTNLPEIWSSLVEVKDVERLPNGGTKLGWVYKMTGVRFEGTTETTEYVANQRLVTKNKGGVSSIITWTFESEDDTKVTFEVDYTLNIPVLRKLAEPLLVKLNENEADLLLSNLKAKMEI